MTWSTARTLADLGELMALWAEGKTKSWPGHHGGPDPETSHLTHTLAALNRAGYLTTCSQPGVVGPGYDGLEWRQRAAVEGLIADDRLLGRLRAAATAAGLTVIVHGPAGSARGIGRGVTATKVDGRPYTEFGARLGRRAMKGQWPGIKREALRAVIDALQVTVIDPVYGRDTALWPALAGVMT